MIVVVQEVISEKHGRGRGSKDEDTKFGQETQLQYNTFDLFDYRNASPSLPVLEAHSKPLHLCSVLLRMMSLMAAINFWELCKEVRGDSWGD